MDLTLKTFKVTRLLWEKFARKRENMDWAHKKFLLNLSLLDNIGALDSGLSPRLFF